MSGPHLSRRTAIQGLGVSLALPWLEAMGPQLCWSEEPAPENAPPNRLAILYVPNGKNMVDWTPTKEGSDFDLPSILEPLQAHRKQLTVLTGLTADKARANGDGGGDHARALAAFLTGAQPKKTDGTDIRAGISADQLAASRLGHLTRLPSLEIGCESGAMAGNCDSGYSCVYSSTMSWKSATQPLPKEVNPRRVFDRMFATKPSQELAERNRRRKSILDFVQEDSKGLGRQLGAADNRKLNEFFASVRDIETRMDRADSMPAVELPRDFDPPAGMPDSYEEHLRLMCDVLTLAFQTDLTRVCTFVLANEGSNKPYPFIGVPEGHHTLSHHGNDAKKKEKIRKINIFHTTQLAYLLDRLASVEEGEGTLLDHVMVAYGSGNSDGNAHNHNDLPMLLAGGGCGTLKPGRHLRFPKETPLNNLWVSLLQRMELDVRQIGDSTGVLDLG